MHNNKSYRRSPNAVNDRLISGPFILAVVVLVILIVGYGTWPTPYNFLVDLTAEPEQNQQEQPPKADVSEPPAAVVDRPATKPKPIAIPTIEEVQSALEAMRPDGVTINAVLINDKGINIEGYADNNQAVARFLRVIDNKVGEPRLNMVKQEQRDQQSVSEFSITVKQDVEP